MPKLFALKGWFRHPLRIMAVALFATIITYALYAKMTGITGRTAPSAGCTCHGASSSNTSLSHSGETSVLPGSSNNYTITVQNSSQSKAGINIAVKTTQTGSVNAGSLTAGSGLQSLSGELTHTSPKNMSGGEADFSFSWTAPNDPGEYYMRAAGNAVNGNSQNTGDQWNFMNPVKITVKGVELTKPNGGESWCAGSTESITWNSTGVSSVKIELSSDGGSSWPTVIAASVSGSSYSWDIPAGADPGDNYKVRVSDASASSLNDVSASAFTIGGGHTITSSPSSKTACTGENVTFKVTASGSGLSYQWRKNGANISGATNEDYAISNVKLSDAGDYDCIVSGPCGDDATSSTAELTVNETPSISIHPKPKTACDGEEVTFSVTASGTNISYQWQKDESDIAGATGDSYTISSVGQSDEGAYRVIVSGDCSPAATSHGAMLTIGKEPAITGQPEGASVCEGEELKLSVKATGEGLSYKWRKGGAIISGATSADYIVEEAAASDSGSYDCVIDGDCGSPLTTKSVSVSIALKPVFTSQPEDISAPEGLQAKFSVAVEGEASYQWEKDGSVLDGETGSELIIESATPADEGSYTCVASNSCGETESASAMLSVIPAGDGPVLLLTKSSYDFGEVATGASMEFELEGLIANSGDETLNITEIKISGENSGDFMIVSPPALPASLEPGKSLSLSVSFSPKSNGNKTAQVDFMSNSELNPPFMLSGAGFTAALSAEGLHFGPNMIGEAANGQFELKNSGSVSLDILEISLSGDDDGNFEITEPSSTFTIEPGMAQTIEVSFAPQTEGDFTAMVNVVTDRGEFSNVASLAGSSFATSVSELPAAEGLKVTPNPGGGSVEIAFTAIESGAYQLFIFDKGGRLVKEFNGFAEAGSREQHRWEGIDNEGGRASSGAYSAIIALNGRTSSIEIYLTK